MTDKSRALLADRYRIERELGAGGMATVYLAEDIKHGRKVAIKVFRPELAAVLGGKRFLAEVKNTAQLQHPHIVPLFDSGSDDGLPFYVMPYVTGETLRDRLTRDGRLPMEDALAIARAVASALDYAHEQGVIHRDVKPENVLLSHGVAMVADFGIARAVSTAGGERITETGLAIGTPAYMSPEQAAGDRDLDGRSDVYALACVLYEMLIGEPPFTGATGQAIIARHFTEPAPSAKRKRADVSVAVDAAVSRALAKTPADRFASPAAFMNAISSTAIEVAPRPAVAEPGRRARTTLVGRTHELADLLARLDGLAQGRGGFVLLGGEPGVGKTRLAEEVQAEARKRGLLCLTGHCQEMEGAPPYLPIIEELEQASRLVPLPAFREALGSAASEIARIMPALRQLFDDIPPPLELAPDQQRHYLFARYREFVARGVRMFPMVVLHDDLHWADDATLLLVEHLARDLTELPILLIGTYRDVELDVARPFAKTLERLTRQHLADRISLRRLPGADVAMLLAKLSGATPPPTLVKAIVHATEGNPFFVEEVFQHLKEEGRLFDASGAWRTDLALGELDVPEGVRLVLGRRLERVSAECKAALNSAAVIGSRFDLAVLEAVGETTEEALLDALEEAERAGLIIPAAAGRVARYAFTHELIRATLAGSLSAPRRQRKHLRIGEALERVFVGKLDTVAADLARHYYQAGAASDPERTAGYLLLAAQRALIAAAFDEALAQAERALSLEELGDRRRADMLAVRAAAFRGLGRWDDSIASYESALTGFERLGERDTVAQTVLDFCYVLAWLGLLDRSQAVIQRGLAAAGETSGSVRAQLLAWAGVVTSMQGRYAAALEMVGEAERIGHALQDPFVMAMATYSRGHVPFTWGIAADAIQPLSKAVTGLRGLGQPWFFADAEHHLRTSLFFMGRSVAARPGLAEQRLVAEQVGHAGAVMGFDWIKALEDFVTSGDLAGLEAFGEWAQNAWKPLGGLSDFATEVTARAQFCTGRWDDAISLLLVKAESSQLFAAWRDVLWTSLFQFKAHRRDRDAVAYLDAHRQTLPEPGKPAFGGAWWGLSSVIEGLMTLGERDRAAALYPAAQQMVEQGFLITDRGVNETAAAVAAAAGRQYGVAERHFENALRLAQELPHILGQADTRRWYGWMLNDRRTPDDVHWASSLLTEARVIYERMGMPKHLEMTDALRVQVGALS